MEVCEKKQIMKCILISHKELILWKHIFQICFNLKNPTWSSEGCDWTDSGFDEVLSRNSKASLAGLILNSSIETLSSIKREPKPPSLWKSFKLRQNSNQCLIFRFADKRCATPDVRLLGEKIIRWTSSVLTWFYINGIVFLIWTFKLLIYFSKPVAKKESLNRQN